MARVVYSKRERTRALYLLASTIRFSGQWLEAPAYTHIAERTGVGRHTLRRWWHARTPQQDALLQEHSRRIFRQMLELGMRRAGHRYPAPFEDLHTTCPRCGSEVVNLSVWDGDPGSGLGCDAQQPPE